MFPKPRRPKIVLDIRSTPVDGTQTGAVIFNIGIRMAKKLFDGMTIITPMMRNEVCNQFQIDPQTMGIWPSGVSTTLFNPEKYDKNTLRKAFELEGKFVVLYHGSVGANYEQVQGRGIVESIKSIELLKDQYPDVVLYILGDIEVLRY
jgi:glycosyltransferase involved in cell wall biosynthesis